MSLLRDQKLWFKSKLSSVSRMFVGKHVRALIVQAGEFQFAVDPEDLGVGRHLRLRGEYGREELARIEPYIHDDATVVVVGTHVGTLAIPIASRCKQVVGYEANPLTYELLKTNIAINGVSNFVAHNLAACEAERKLSFLLNRVNSGGSKIVPQTKDYAYYYDAPQQIEVSGVRLDDHLISGQIDLIIMDIEGAEYFALQGMQETLKKTRTLIVEFTPHHLRSVSGVTVAQFVELVNDFDTLTIPSLNQTVERADFVATLQAMFDKNQEDDGIVFSRKKSAAQRHTIALKTRKVSRNFQRSCPPRARFEF